MVRLPVTLAAGSVTALLLKYAPYGQPCPHLFRYMHLPRPFIGSVRCSTRPMIMFLPGNSCPILLLTCFSRQFISIGGKKWLSGSCGRPIASPLIPANFSTYVYHGSISLYRIGQSTPCPSFALASKSRSDQR